MYCINCGYEIAEGSKFCPKCGTAQMNVFTTKVPEKSGAKKTDKPKKEKKKKSPAKAIIAVILIFAILAGGGAAGYFWIYPKFFNEKYLKNKAEKLTDKEIIEFCYDDFNGDGINEAFALTGKGNKKEIKKGEIWFVSDRAGDKVKENINGHLNGILNDNGSKYISVEVNDEEEVTSFSYIYGVEEKDKYVEPDISGKYSEVHMEDDRIVDANGTELQISGISGNKGEAVKTDSTETEFSNVTLCKYGDYYYSLEEDGFYKYDSDFNNKTILKSDIYYYDSSLSVYNNTLYFANGKDKKIEKYNADNYSFEDFYISSDENAYNIELYLYNNNLIVSEYGNAYLYNSDEDCFEKIFEGNFIKLIGSKVYYQVSDEDNGIQTLMIYDLESGKTSSVWSMNDSDIGNGEDISPYLWSIEDVEEFDGKVYFTIGSTQGSGGFYYGYAYCLDSSGNLTEIQKDGDPIDGGFGIGRYLLKHNNSLYVTLGSDRYSGSYGIGKIADSKVTVINGSIYNVDNFDSRYIINYKYNNSENETEKAGLYVYDIETNNNQCVSESEKYISAHQNEISADIEEYSTSITPDMYSVNYNYSALCGDYIVFNPVVCLPDGVWTNAGHMVVDCGYETVKLN